MPDKCLRLTHNCAFLCKEIGAKLGHYSSLADQRQYVVTVWNIIQLSTSIRTNSKACESISKTYRFKTLETKDSIKTAIF